MKTIIPLSTLLLALGTATVAAAGPRDFVVEHAGAGASRESAQPFIDQFLRTLEGLTGWPASAGKGEWLDDQKELEQAIAEHKPGFGIVDPEIFLALRKKEALEPIAAVKGRTFNKGHYSLVVKDAALKGLGDLKGKKLISNHLSSPRYLDKVAFEGKLDVEKHFALVKTAQPSKPIKAVDRGEADAALLDDEQLEQMKELAPDLKVIWTSPALPPTPVVAFTRSASAADRAAVAKALLKVCGDEKGKAVCESMFIDKFVPVDKAIFNQAAKRYEK